jgi:hypothetical protein
MTDELQQIFNLIIDNTLEKNIESAVYRPVCVALLARLYKANKNINFSKDITNAVTKIFDLDFTEIYKKEKSDNCDHMPDLFALMTDTLVNFFKDKKVIIHFCNIVSCNIKSKIKICKIRVDYTEQ